MRADLPPTDRSLQRFLHVYIPVTYFSCSYVWAADDDPPRLECNEAGLGGGRMVYILSFGIRLVVHDYLSKQTVSETYTSVGINMHFGRMLKL